MRTTGSPVPTGCSSDEGRSSPEQGSAAVRPSNTAPWRLRLSNFDPEFLTALPFRARRATFGFFGTRANVLPTNQRYCTSLHTNMQRSFCRKKSLSKTEIVMGFDP
jgi:hypothetical protein